MSENLLIWIIIVIIGVYIYKKLTPGKKESIIKSSKEDVKQKKLTREELKTIAARRNAEWRPGEELKSESTFEVDNIPKGYVVYEDDSFFVQGVTFRFEACVTWAQGEGHKISFKREPNNKHDSNAIAIFGKSSTGRRKLGYVAADIADDLVYKELDKKMKVRLLSVAIKEAPFIEFEILVNSEDYLKSE